MIAGTYTPFVLIKMNNAWGLGLLAVVWTMAVIGIVIKLFAPRFLEGLTVGALSRAGLGRDRRLASVGRPRCRNGWRCCSCSAVVLYTVGVVFHLWERLPYQNAIWHGFVLHGRELSLRGRARRRRLLSLRSDENRCAFRNDQRL